MKRLFRILKWMIIAAVTLPVLTLGYMAYIVHSFDDETLPENYGKVAVNLFMAENDSQPLIVGLGGAEGGDGWAGPHGEKQRSMLKDNGYAFLSVAYFGAEGTPDSLDRISVNGVHNAVMKAAEDPRINENCIAVMGVSRGGELALLLGSYYKAYKGVVGIVPGSSVFAAMTPAMTTPGFSYNEKSLPFVPVPWSATPALLSRDLRGAFEIMMKDTEAMQAAAINVENIAGPVLFISGKHDEQWPSMEMSKMMMERLNYSQFPYYKRHLALEGGHSEHHDHFGEVMVFLNQQLRAQPGCARSH
ncbi:acyl-CoA thioester hydrolase/BAAT C-terminal domain-containing protein [Gilvimarinus algae]|uniref:Acyl-CoA thioester hydrolase/BAAT C-terminal domain-containing protein n=1 Tax=Gilvimarinus algae TaxID=3058037 RepID=A0ABT8TG09_9GAMM|nr:acyl-CoA thioester hydrolase/BAAT C-terminal domain-containing protein [Gilvimarinus sp. SDUM040014]MDO3383032.1 acyl-CoA thioester hydrolase/BAAT C-terminal domain-containing protein [Gilvimarinus sp. SDUM040014]